MSIPETFKALKSQPDAGIAIEDVHLSTELAPYEILVKNKAVGLNPTDWKHSIGDWGDAGYVVGCDGAGDVIEVGSDVKHVIVGNRVAAFMYGTQDPNNGAFAEYTRYNASCAWKLPEGMTYAEAASFPIPFSTAVQNLYFRHDLPYPSVVGPNSFSIENILIWGGSTAVGHHAIQLAHRSGYRVITTASEKNHEYLKSIGADVTIDYKDPDVLGKIRASLEGLPLKKALDTACEKGSTEIAIDSIDDVGGQVNICLPVSDEVSNRRANVKIEFVLAYCLVTRTPIKFAKVIPIPFIPEDNEKALAWYSKEQTGLLDGWKTGVGSAGGYKTQKLRIGQGLDGVIEGLNIMKRGEYGAEKLVYNI